MWEVKGRKGRLGWAGPTLCLCCWVGRCDPRRCLPVSCPTHSSAVGQLFPTLLTAPVSALAGQVRGRRHPLAEAGGQVPLLLPGGGGVGAGVWAGGWVGGASWLTEATPGLQTVPKLQFCATASMCSLQASHLEAPAPPAVHRRPYRHEQRRLHRDLHIPGRQGWSWSLEECRPCAQSQPLRCQVYARRPSVVAVLCVACVTERPERAPAPRHAGDCRARGDGGAVRELQELHHAAPVPRGGGGWVGATLLGGQPP